MSGEFQGSGGADGLLPGFSAGSRVAGYRLEEQVGAGGMAVVFRAIDVRLGRPVALKILAPALASDVTFRRRFIRESRAAAAVDDPHIIPVHEAGEADGVLFIAMRYVPGGDVRSLLHREGPLPSARVAAIVSPVASALDAAHDAGLVHRDVKPANMLVDVRPGRPDHVYLSDFGLSKAALPSVGLTGSGQYLGTPNYIAPEQIQGQPVDGRTDQYALACAAFEMLTGQAPFQRDDATAVIWSHLSAPPPPLTTLRPDLPAAVDRVFAQALAKAAADRYSRCADFAEALRQALGLAPYGSGPGATPVTDHSPADHPSTLVVWSADAGGADLGILSGAAVATANPGPSAVADPAVRVTDEQAVTATGAPGAGEQAIEPRRERTPGQDTIVPLGRRRGRGKVIGISAAAAAAVVATGIVAAVGWPGHSPKPRPASRALSHQQMTPGLQALNPGTDAPERGGTLNMIGEGDVDYMDYNASYYTPSYLAQRMWLRELYAYPAIPGEVTTVAPDLATGPPVVSNGGKTYTLTVRTGADWNTSPARQVTGADVILGMKRACNPTSARFGGLVDYEAVVVGYTQFCDGFAHVSPTSLSAINTYINTHQISGVTASGQTITFNLTQPSSYFSDAMTLDSFAPAPIESEKYLPGSAASAQHMIADGPYQISSYVPTQSITFTRNPAWNASTDPIRKAYVNQIDVTETSTQQAAQRVLETGGASGGMEFDVSPPGPSLNGLAAQMAAGSENFDLGPSYSSNPYLDVNTISPNNNGALAKVAVRRAIFDAINRAGLIQDLGGPAINPPLTHILPNGINGAQDVPASFNPFTYDPARAKADLAAAGYPNGLTLTVLYDSESAAAPKLFRTMQADMAPAGIKLKALAASPADLYVKYMYNKSSARSGTWDIAMTGWYPDWYGDSALTYFNLLYSCAAVVPAGSNFTYYCNKADDALISRATAAPSSSGAARIWAQLDENITNAAVSYQITQNLQPNYHSSFVHNAVYVPALENFDPTNVWLSKS